MVLTILLTAGWYVEGSDDPGRSLLVAAIGCNLAWGLIDGCLYVMSAVYERGRRLRLHRAAQRTDPVSARVAARDALQEASGSLFEPHELDRLAERLVTLARTTPAPDHVRTRRSDLAPLAASVVLNVAATVPATLALLLIDDWRVALRVSNAVIVGMLFVAGFAWGRAAGFRPWRSGCTLLAIGVGMVAVAVALGG
jgi:VIT1/CCC1 family predicted Fe2+/Mn2+ transporter